MPVPYWELSVLCRAVAYRNLSSAADNVGLSQPQLSRIVAKLENELSVTLLDRTSRRKSGWTPVAFKVAEQFTRSSSKLEQEIHQSAGESMPSVVKVGSLEGLAPVAATFCNELFDLVRIEAIELDVHDLNRLEELYLQGSFDLIFASREPGRSKPKYSRVLGHQSVDHVGRPGVQVVSAFEHQTGRDTTGREIEAHAGKRLISNSLAVRKHWLERFGGTGFLPSGLKRSGKGLPVFVIGSQTLSPAVWEKIAVFPLSLADTV